MTFIYYWQIKNIRRGQNFYQGGNCVAVWCILNWIEVFLHRVVYFNNKMHRQIIIPFLIEYKSYYITYLIILYVQVISYYSVITCVRCLHMKLYATRAVLYRILRACCEIWYRHVVLIVVLILQLRS